MELSALARARSTLVVGAMTHVGSLRSDYHGPERRHQTAGRRRYDLPPWATLTLAFIAALQPIIVGVAAILAATR